MQVTFSKPFMFRLAVFVTVMLAEVHAVQSVLQNREDFSCVESSAPGLCFWIASLPRRAVYVSLALVSAAALKPPLWNVAGTGPAAASFARPGPALLHFAGLAMIFMPFWLIPFLDLEVRFAQAVPAFLLGAFCAALGALLWLMPLRVWRQWLFGSGPFLPAAMAAVFALPDLIGAASFFGGGNRAMTWLTFVSVEQVLSVFGAEATSLPEERIFALNGFAVQVGNTCSGIEGIVLIALFVAGYALLSGGTLRWKPYWLVLFPAAVLLSWVFNILRISVLIWLGAHVSPRLAVDGFHSYAGWLAFSLLAFAVLAIVHNTAFFHKAPDAPRPRSGPPLRSDPLFARFVPFILFMMSGTLTPLLWEDPADGYPLRVAFMVLGLGLFWPALKTFRWRAGPADWAAGCAVAALWLWTAPEAAASAAGAPDPVWILCRLLGTVLLVPVIEELFFRAYVLERIAGRPGAAPWRVLAGLAVSSLLFAALHDRWLAGALAGLAFGLLYLRTRHPGGAVQAHMLANGLIASAAVASGDFGLI